MNDNKTALIISKKCIIPDCHCRSDLDQGRNICVEPDDDGWICERCWINLHRPLQVIVQPVAVQLHVTVSIGEPVIGEPVITVENRRIP